MQLENVIPGGIGMGTIAGCGILLGPCWHLHAT